MKRKGLTRLENLVQELIEGTFGRLFGGHLEPLDVVNHLVKAIEDNEQNSQREVIYQVALSPEDFRVLTSNNPNLAQIIAETAQQLGSQMGITTAESPMVRLVAEPGLNRRKMEVSSRPAGEVEGDQITRTYRHRQGEDENLRKMHELDAFLIIQGRRHIPLNQPVTSIGRRTENDIVLDHPSVSRLHVQIRWRFGKFILYDISRRGRTLVNGYHAGERVLRPGDVISLGEALIVYGEGIERKTSLPINGSSDNHTLARLPKK